MERKIFTIIALIMMLHSCSIFAADSEAVSGETETKISLTAMDQNEGQSGIGDTLEQYKVFLESILTKAAEIRRKLTGAENNENGIHVYRAVVVDQNGDPVPEAWVNFCTDTSCIPVETDEDGAAVFEGAEEQYHLQVADAPEGYDFPDESDVSVGPEDGTVTLVITKE